MSTRWASCCWKSSMLDQKARDGLKQLLGRGIRFDEPMARHTAFRIGGSADGMAEPQNVRQLKVLVQWSQQNNMAYMVLGGGTNVLVKDGGFRGVVIRLDKLAGDLDWETHGSQVRVTAGAAVPTRRLCALALRHGWQGMNFALGIPGSLGGAITMNAGTAYGAMADVLTTVTLLTGTGDERCLARGDFEGHYRQMQWPEGLQGPKRVPFILLRATLEFCMGNRHQIFQEARRIVQARVAKQPTWRPSAGCFFKNPSPHIPAGQLIDQAGLKGVRIGDAQVARRHANFIVNRGHATAADVIALAQKVQDEVKKKFGIELTTEVRIVGQETST